MGRPPRGPRGIAQANRRRERPASPQRSARVRERFSWWSQLVRRLRASLRWFVLRPVRAWLITGPLSRWFRRQPAPPAPQQGVMKQFPRERSWQ